MTIERYVASRWVLGTLMLVVLTVGMVYAATTVRGKYAAPQGWPSFVMTYEKDGRTGIETHRIEWQGLDYWRDEIISATPIDTPYGPMELVGSFRAVEGRVATSYVAYLDHLSESILEGNVHQVPAHPVMVPYSFSLFERDLDLNPSRVEIPGVRVCSITGCVESAQGLRFLTENGDDFLFTNDPIGIPLRAPGFRVLDLNILSGGTMP